MDALSCTHTPPLTLDFSLLFVIATPCFVCVLLYFFRYVVDSSTYWCLGRPVLNPSVPDNSVESLLKRFHTPEVCLMHTSSPTPHTLPV